MKMGSIQFSAIVFSIMAVMIWVAHPASSDVSTKGSATSFDGVQIVYSVLGDAEPALVFIHGGFADRGYWSGQMEHFSSAHRVVTIDLAGHGESGKDRKDWDIPSFAEDVRAVVNKEKIGKAVLIGNSLGGPVALKAAALLPATVVAVVAVDTLQDIGREVPPDYYRKMAEAYRSNFTGTIKQMVRSLFHPGTNPELLAKAENQMLDSSPEMAVSLMTSFEYLNLAELVMGLDVHIRCINGDLYPTQMEKNRALYPDFDAVILPKTGHYPMLENPALFNRHLETILRDLEKK